jgi:hypothetical protein
MLVRWFKNFAQRSAGKRSCGNGSRVLSATANKLRENILSFYWKSAILVTGCYAMFAKGVAQSSDAPPQQLYDFMRFSRTKM